MGKIVPITHFHSINKFTPSHAYTYTYNNIHLLKTKSVWNGNTSRRVYARVKGHHASPAISECERDEKFPAMELGGPGCL